MRSHKRLMGVMALVILALTVFTGTASAHECFIASRSDVGNLAATHSANWVNVASIQDAFTFVQFFYGLDPLTAGQLQYAVQKAQSRGFPSQITIFVNDHVPGGVLPPGGGGNTTNGKGIDHVFDWLPTLMGIYTEAAGMNL